jgi:hypothetical protein
LTFLPLKDIANLPEINRVSLVEVRFFLQVPQHNVHLPVSDHQAEDVIFDIVNLVVDQRCAVIDTLLVATQLNLFSVNVDLTLFRGCNSSELILLIHNRTVDFWNNLNLHPQILSCFE